MIQRAVVINALGFQLVWWAMALGLPQSRFALIAIQVISLYINQSVSLKMYMAMSCIYWPKQSRN
ncbi:MAG: hypothetical protein EBV84_06960 [Betaproteobacteria bacterium]|nr:hypothetical protein [Betaproteobacteria bacterium]